MNEQQYPPANTHLLVEYLKSVAGSPRRRPMKILVVAIDDGQVQDFLYTHRQISPSDVLRIQSVDDLRGRFENTLYWLPDAMWHLGPWGWNVPQEVDNFWGKRKFVELTWEQLGGQEPFELEEEPLAVGPIETFIGECAV